MKTVELFEKLLIKTNTIKLAEAKETAVPEVIGLGTVVKATEIRKLIDSIEINKK